MTKRIKKVFHIDELVHIYISQSQEEGMTKKSGFSNSRQAFFKGKSIYSYGYHYHMGELYHDNKTLLINSDKNSVTTQTQKSSLDSAASHLQVFYVPNLSNPKDEENVLHLSNIAADLLDEFIRSRTSHYLFKQVRQAISDFNAYCALFKIKDRINLDDDTWKMLEEMRDIKHAKRLIEQEKRNEKQKEKWVLAKKERKARKIKDLVKVKDWKKGGDRFYSYGLPCFLRVKDNEVQTSQGASVPLNQAIYLLKQLIKNGINTEKQKIGHYEFTIMQGETISIGCHDIQLKEAMNVLGKYLTLEVV